MMIYNVFGKLLGVKKSADGWQVFRVDLAGGKHPRLHEMVIPDFVNEEEILGWFDDIYHEAASNKHPQVFRVE